LAVLKKKLNKPQEALASNSIFSPLNWGYDFALLIALVRITGEKTLTHQTIPSLIRK
jgi:hypothetical protein